MRIKQQNSNRIVLVNTVREKLRITGIFLVALTITGLLLVTSLGIVWIVIPVIIGFALAGWIMGENIIIDVSTEMLTILRRGFFLRPSRRDIPLSAVQYVALTKEHGILSRYDNPDDLRKNIEMARYWGNYWNMQDKWIVYLHMDKENLFIDKSVNESTMQNKALNIANFMGKKLVNTGETNDGQT